MKNKIWTYDELIVAFNLYCKTPFGRLHSRNPDIIELANIIDRTPNSIALKLVNFASFDENLQKRGIKGMSHAGKKDKEIWDKFHNNWEDLVFESEILYEKYKGETIYKDEEGLTVLEGRDIDRIVKTRLNQSFFRKTILASYDHQCCITGISIPELLIASHIVPWAVDKENRLNPHNGICLNALHDRAFDAGLITLSDDYNIIISNYIKTGSINAAVNDFILRYENKKISLPSKFVPKFDFLDYHRKEVFKG